MQEDPRENPDTLHASFKGNVTQCPSEIAHKETQGYKKGESGVRKKKVGLDAHINVRNTQHESPGSQGSNTRSPTSNTVGFFPGQEL